MQILSRDTKQTQLYVGHKEHKHPYYIQPVLLSDIDFLLLIHISN